MVIFHSYVKLPEGSWLVIIQLSVELVEELGQEKNEVIWRN